MLSDHLLPHITQVSSKTGNILHNLKHEAFPIPAAQVKLTKIIEMIAMMGVFTTTVNFNNTT